MPRPRKSAAVAKEAASYRYPEADLPSRPEIGAQAHFKKAKPPATYRFDSSLAPELCWDGQNPAREQGEAAIREIADCGLRIAELAQQAPTAERDAELGRLRERLAEAERRLRGMSGPFLNWAGKAERLSFEVPTLPLFVHERLSTKAILDTLREHKRDKQTTFLDELFGAADRPLADQVLRAYEHRDQWVNRMVLGDSLVAMNSLLHYESLGGQVQMIYMDPPYGVKFGSNFQPFVRKRDVSHNADEDLTREPEMVQAYRDTWELGLHSYLTYLRDRLLLCRDLLAPSGSVFVQISDENLHHVREVMDEVFGAENFVSQVFFLKTSGFDTSTVASLGDYLLWYAKDKERLRVNKAFQSNVAAIGEGNARWLLLADGTCRGVTAAERRGDEPLPEGARLYTPDNLVSQGAASEPQPFEYQGKVYNPPDGSHWKANYPEGMRKLAEAGRLHAASNTLRYRRYPTDFPFAEIGNMWEDTRTGNFTDDKIYAVQTASKVVARCLLMTTDPGDLVLDPTCGSGTTAYVAEQWGRRWITMDTSRVPLALARQRLLTATFDYYELQDEARGPGGGFVYKRKQNQRGEEVGGIVPHITLGSIANDEPPQEQVLVDRPETRGGVVRVTGPFTVEATIPAAEGLDEEPETPGLQSEDHRSHVERMLEVLRHAPTVRLPGNQTATLRQIRPPAKTLALSAEAELEVRGEVSGFGFQVSGMDEPNPNPDSRLPKPETRNLKPERNPTDGIVVHGVGGMAAGNGSGRGGVPCNARVSAGRAVRVDQSGAAGGSLGSEQHRGGTGAVDERGVSSVPRAGKGVAAGGRNADGTGTAAGLPSSDDCGRDGESTLGGSATAERVAHEPCADSRNPEPETRNLKLETVPVAILFGPAGGPISERLVREAWDEAGLKRYARLFVIGFGIDPKAREFVERAGQIGIPCVYLQATMDLQMGDLLKNLRSSQVFSVCGLPDVRVSSFQFPVSSDTPRNSKRETRNSELFQVELLGLDTFDPATMEPAHLSGSEVPAWLLDTDYNGMVFRVRQAFFPRTGAWESLKKSLKAEFEDTVWDHLAGTVSAPFEAGEHGQVAVKVIDPRGNELVVVKTLEAKR